MHEPVELAAAYYKCWHRGTTLPGVRVQRQDRPAVEGLLTLLAERAATGTSIVAATHDERFVAAFATRLLELRGGHLVQDRAA